MADLSKVILFGRLTRDPELRYTTSGTAVTTLSLAVNRRIKRGDNWEEEANFFDVVVFGRRAETSAEYLKKGSQALIDGELVQRRWETPEGQKRSKVEVMANNVQFIGRPQGGSQQGGGSGGGESYDPPPIDDDDIPF
jgi:single-strand DNA-binding protein